MKDLIGCKKICAFKNNYLWFSKPQFFNDPFDCNMEFLKHYEELINTIRPFRDVTIDGIINRTKDFGICCFSESNDNIHMWSHYTERHTGVCIEYDSTNFNDYFSNSLSAKCELLEVDYRKELIDLNNPIEWDNDFLKPIRLIMTDPRELDKLFEKLLLQKNSAIWTNEREWRLIIGGLAKKNNPDKEFCEGYKVEIDPNMITSVIFGLNTPDKLKSEMQSIFGHKMKYQEVKLDFKNWTLKVETR